MHFPYGIAQIERVAPDDHPKLDHPTCATTSQNSEHATCQYNVIVLSCNNPSETLSTSQ